MEKRLLLAFVLSMLVLVVSQPLLEKRMKQTRRSSQTPASTNQTQPQPAENAPKTSPSVSPREKTTEVPMPSTKAESEREIVLENSLTKITLSNRGGVVKNWVLKRYKDSDLKTLDLVASDPAHQNLLPLRLFFLDNKELTDQINSALFVEFASEQKITGTNSSSSVTLHYAENGVAIEKTLTLSPDSYLINLQIHVQKDGMSVPYFIAWPARFGDNALDTQSNARDLVTGTEGKATKTSLAKIKGAQDQVGSFKYAGIEDRYFATIFMQEPPISRVQALADEVLISISPQPVRLFVGPKEIDVLRGIDPQLESLVDFGWFGIIGKPLFIGLKWIYGYCRNYGVAVILLTIIINMAIFPLRWKSMVSAQRMQKLQPRIKAIQERYKKYKVNDPKRQEMNQEMMALYKEHGVNPLGGCLPMLLQMPILIAFYNVLNVAIDLRQVKFLWIPDLSQYDKTFVLVIVMVVTQFIMQKLTPTPSSDPAQAKMFMLMPLIFGFMFAKVASGLVLYWLTGNVIGIIQQIFLNKFGMTAAPTGGDEKAGKRKPSTA